MSSSSESSIECPICFNTLDLLKQECNHNICFTCYLKMHLHSNNLICPLCRKTLKHNVQKRTIEFQPTGIKWRSYRIPGEPFEQCEPVVVKAYVVQNTFAITCKPINISNGCGPTVETMIFKLSPDNTVEYYYKPPMADFNIINFEKWSHNVPTYKFL